MHFNENTEPEALIGDPPGWALRWGMSALLGALGLLLGLSAFIRYPDIVEARVVLTTQNPPLRIKATSSGELERIFVKNGQEVQPGDRLASLKNAADLDDIGHLDSLLASLGTGEAASLLDISLPSGLRLGELQADYAKLREQLSELQFYLRQDGNLLKISNLRQQMASMAELDASLQGQLRLLEAEAALARKNYERDSILFFDKNSLSRLEMEQSQFALLRKRRELEALRSERSGNSLKVRQLEAQVIDLQQLQSSVINSRLLPFRQMVGALLGSVAEWKQAWLVLAPIAGTVDLSAARQEHQFLQAGEEVLTLVPGQSAGRVACRAVLPIASIGKVRPGLQVRLRLDAYPYREFGSLEGSVGNIALAPVTAGYEVEVLLSDSLRTNHGKILPFRQELQGTLRVITEKRSLLQRIMDRFN